MTFVPPQLRSAASDAKTLTDEVAQLIKEQRMDPLMTVLLEDSRAEALGHGVDEPVGDDTPARRRESERLGAGSGGGSHAEKAV